MTPTRQFPPRFVLATVVFVVLALAASGCGSSDKEAKRATTTTTTMTTSTTTAAANAATDSAYCKTIRRRFVHELDGTTDTFASDPVALKKYWRYSVAFVETATRQAPAEIRSDWPITTDGPLHKITPVLEKYDFDIARLKRDGSAEEQAVLEPPTNKEQERAQTAIDAYESRWCGTEHPQAADVSFRSIKPTNASKAYCAAGEAYSDYFDEQVIAKKATVDAVRAFAKSPGLEARIAKLEATAPAEIKADVDARAEWTRHQWVDVLEKFGYDVRKLILTGSAADRANLQHSAPAVAGHFARTVAYEMQVCGA